jgi:hypothetical protein
MEHLIENCPYVTYNESLQSDIPFLQDYSLHDHMLLQNIEFQIAGKCYSWKMRIRGSMAVARIVIDPEQWRISVDHTFYEQVVHIKAVLQFIRSARKEMGDWFHNFNKLNTYFWMENVTKAIETNHKMFAYYEKGWLANADQLTAFYERKRVKEFAMLLNLKFNRTLCVKENGITFKILSYIFDFHGLNRSKLFFPSQKRKAAGELFFDN